MRVYVLSTEKTPAPGKIGDDGLYLYATTPAAATTPHWDGTEEEDSENNGDPGASPDTSLDQLPVYTPSVNEDELSVFLETQYKGATIWVWNAKENFTGGNWNTKPSMQVMGKTADGQRRILKWTYDKSTYKNLPTGVIFVPTGQNQTSDLQYVNHGYYIEGQYDHTVTNTSGIVDVRSKRSDVRSDIYDLQGRKLNTCPTKPGVYIWNGKLYRK